ncbi:MAG: hypothetical protein ACRYGP_06655 [Janthinobacterium lividum]
MLLEDGRSIGTLTTSHDDIRAFGAGRHDFWDGELWFSSQDGRDPRGDGRTYGLRVRARLAGSALLVLAASLVLFAALLASRLGTKRGVRRAKTGRLDTFGISFALSCGALLSAFAWNFAVRPMPLIFGDDSFTYVFPGVLWHAGESVAGQSTRDVGYLALTALALRLGSLRAIPPLQLVGVLLGIACIFATLFLALAPLTARLRQQVSAGALAVCGSAVAAAYGIMLASDDGFVVGIYRALGEALHFLPTAVTLLFFVLGWIAPSPARRLTAMVLAITAADLSVAVKPHSLLVLALCVCGLLVNGVRYRTVLRSPAILTLCLLSATLVVSIHRFDRWVTPDGFDFGPKTLFCNHLDVAAPVFDASTPERARVKAEIESSLKQLNPEWALLGYHGDSCSYGVEFNRAMVAAARAENMEPPVWLSREFAGAVLRNPLGYAWAVSKQIAFALANPIAEIDDRGRGKITEREWTNLAPYVAATHMSRDAFDVAISSWVPSAFPQIAEVGKTLLTVVGTTFPLFTFGGAGIAAARLSRRRTRVDVRAEVVLLAIAVFWMAFILTPALAHTFDVHRYLVDVLPFTLLWWTASVVYVTSAIGLFCAHAVERGLRRGRAPAPVSDQSSIS